MESLRVDDLSALHPKGFLPLLVSVWFTRDLGHASIRLATSAHAFPTTAAATDQYENVVD
jgi:hypothetical protein